MRRHSEAGASRDSRSVADRRPWFLTGKRVAGAGATSRPPALRPQTQRLPRHLVRDGGRIQPAAAGFSPYRRRCRVFVDLGRGTAAGLCRLPARTAARVASGGGPCRLRGLGKRLAGRPQGRAHGGLLGQAIGRRCPGAAIADRPPAPPATNLCRCVRAFPAVG